MKQQFNLRVKAFLLLMGFVFFQSFIHKGGDYYKVLLNGKLVAEQYLTHTEAPKALNLNSTNQNDRLTFFYSHCGKLGTNRTISLKNEKGQILKQWKFSDIKWKDMQIPVKEILGASLNLHTGSVYYASGEIPHGKLLIKLNLFSDVARK